jgi:hypothetical protein
VLISRMDLQSSKQSKWTHQSPENSNQQVVGLNNAILQDIGGGAKIKTRVRFVLGQLMSCFLLTTDTECFVMFL